MNKFASKKRFAHTPMWFEINFSVCLFIFLQLTGCYGGAVISESMENIDVKISFMHVEREEEKKRIDEVIRANARFPENIKRRGKGSKFSYQFIVKNFDALNIIHHEIIYNQKGEYVLNMYEPMFFVNYSTVDISASIDIIVTFRVTPRSILKYIKYNGEEVDISHMVGSDGIVKLKTEKGDGQRYINAKIISGKIERYISIDILTQEVTEITQNQYMQTNKLEGSRK